MGVLPYRHNKIRKEHYKSTTNLCGARYKNSDFNYCYLSGGVGLPLTTKIT